MADFILFYFCIHIFIGFFNYSGRRRGRGSEMKDYSRERPRGRGGGKDKIDALGRLLYAKKFLFLVLLLKKNRIKTRSLILTLLLIYK